MRAMDAATVEAFTASATASTHLLQANLETAAHHMGSTAGHMSTVVYSLADAAAAPDAAVQASWPPHNYVATWTCSADDLPAVDLQHPEKILLG